MSDIHELEVLREQRNEALDRVARTEAHNRSLDEQIEKLTLEIKTKDSEIDELKTAIEDLEAEAIALKQKLKG